MPSHRLYTTGAGGEPVPLDPEATYSLRARVRRTGDGEASVRMDTYLFDDTNPTEDPSSTPIGQTTFVIDVPADGQWHDVTIDIPPDALEEGGLPANMCLLNVRLGVPTTDKSHLDVDQLALIEWRRAADMPDRFGPYELVRNVGQAARELAVPVLPAF
jgi:hypothetical protein